MKRRRQITRSLIAFGLMLALVHYPFLAIGNKAMLIAGIPALYAYLFIIWILIIGTLALLARPGAKERSKSL